MISLEFLPENPPANYIALQRTDNGETTGWFVYDYEQTDTQKTSAINQHNSLIQRIREAALELLPGCDLDIPCYLIKGSAREVPAFSYN